MGEPFFFWLGTTVCDGEEQTKQEGGKEESGSKSRCGIFCSSRKPGSFLFLFPSFPPFFFLSLGLIKEREKKFVPQKKKKKAFDEKESTCTKQFDYPVAFSGPKIWFGSK